MITLSSVSVQKVSWVKSDHRLGLEPQIHNLYYPETVEELESLIRSFYQNGERFDIIGYSSNTLFLPSYKVDNLVCTTKMNRWTETEDNIVCECGVPVPVLSREMVKLGYVGFEGLTDLPGTIASAVYGNAGCRGCSVNALVDSYTILEPDGTISKRDVNDLSLQYRSSSLKRGETQGVILYVSLRKNKGNAEELLKIAEYNHSYRLSTQPSGLNNLGTTFIGGQHPTMKGKVFIFTQKVYRKFTRDYSAEGSFLFALRLWGKNIFAKYLFSWNRYMFLDEVAHDIFPKYCTFLKSLYHDIRLEIEIKG